MFFFHSFSKEILHKNDSKLQFMPFSNINVMRNKANQSEPFSFSIDCCNKLILVL